MGANAWILLSLAAFDVTLLVNVFFYLRAYRPIGRDGLIATTAGLAGFVFHAFLFFEGGFLYLQLATIADIYGLCWLKHQGRLSKIS